MSIKRYVQIWVTKINSVHCHGHIDKTDAYPNSGLRSIEKSNNLLHSHTLYFFIDVAVKLPPNKLVHASISLSLSLSLSLFSSSSLCVFHLLAATQPVVSSACLRLTFAPYNSHYPMLGRHLSHCGLSTELNYWNQPLLIGGESL